jgi:hypothetical protein
MPVRFDGADLIGRSNCNAGLNPKDLFGPLIVYRIDIVELLWSGQSARELRQEHAPCNLYRIGKRKI